MVRKRLQEYIDICLAFRIVTLVFSTIFYIGMSVYQGDDTSYRWVALGMLASCLLSSWLYKNIGDRDPWLRIMFAIEVFSYGMFAVVSGGFSSPYLWYQMNCILLMVTLEEDIVVTILASVWCFFTVVAGSDEGRITYHELNISLGIIIVIGVFYVFRFYIRQINEQKQELLSLNVSLKEEKAKSEAVFLQLTEVYETFSLFAVTNPEKIVMELLQLLNRTIAPNGCMLVKFDKLFRTQKMEYIGLEDEVVQDC